MRADHDLTAAGARLDGDDVAGVTAHVVLGEQELLRVGRVAQVGEPPEDAEGLEATGAQDANFDLMVPLRTLITRTRFLEMRSELDEILLQLEDEEMLGEASIAIRHLLQVAHNGQEDFKLVVPLELLKQKQQSQRLLDILTICISSVLLISGTPGILVP